MFLILDANTLKCSIIFTRVQSIRRNLKKKKRNRRKLILARNLFFEATVLFDTRTHARSERTDARDRMQGSGGTSSRSLDIFRVWCYIGGGGLGMGRGELTSQPP